MTLPAMASAGNLCKKKPALAAKTNKKLAETRKEAACGVVTRSGRQVKKKVKYDEIQFSISAEQRYGLKKLSLSRASLSNSTPAKENQLSNVEPSRNSTFSYVGNENINISNDLNNPVAEETQKKSPKNLAHNPNIIEQILLLDEEIEVGEPKTIKKSNALPTKAEDTVNRFFHRNDIEFKKPDLRQTKKLNKKQRSTVHRKSSVGKVYEFLSSQSDSDSANKRDPAADIIKKLIDEGRVCVSKNRKGTGRPMFKRKKRQVKRNTQPINKNKKEQKVQQKAIILEENIPTLADEDYADNFNDNDTEFHEPYNVGGVGIEEIQPSAQSRMVRQNNKQSINGTFSRLARSVLLNQTEKNDSAQKKITDQRKLLEVARDFVSTPVNRKLSPPPHFSNLSPIPMTTYKAHDKQLGNVSPWRVDEDAHLPSVFHFSKNSSNLPSFSSDYIPSTPRKNNKFRYHMLDSPLALPDNVTPEIQHKSPPSISSFSSNDSNAENMSPPRSASSALHANIDGNVDINADVFNLRQQPNPRRTYSHRSPLKAIKILEVVTLPPWKKTENLNKKTIQEAIKNKSNTEVDANSNKIDLFGFEEFIDDSDTEEQTVPEQTMHDNSSHLNIQSLRDKLHNLNKWRPDNVNQIDKQQQSKPISRVFDNDAGTLMQRNIRKMLCSTMIDPSTSLRSNVVQDLDSDDSDSDEQKDSRKKKTNAMIDNDLFNDPEPQLSFNDKNPHRTYVRPYKKRRKLRHNFVMFLDSDDSGEENESDGEDHEPSIQKKVEHKKKRKKKVEKPDPNLNSFVDNFNSMCKEVEKYELVVE